MQTFFSHAKVIVKAPLCASNNYAQIRLKNGDLQLKTASIKAMAGINIKQAVFCKAAAAFDFEAGFQISRGGEESAIADTQRPKPAASLCGNRSIKAQQKKAKLAKRAAKRRSRDKKADDKAFWVNHWRTTQQATVQCEHCQKHYRHATAKATHEASCIKGKDSVDMAAASADLSHHVVASLRGSMLEQRRQEVEASRADGILKTRSVCAVVFSHSHAKAINTALMGGESAGTILCARSQPLATLWGLYYDAVIPSGSVLVHQPGTSANSIFPRTVNFRRPLPFPRQEGHARRKQFRDPWCPDKVLQTILENVFRQYNGQVSPERIEEIVRTKPGFSADKDYWKVRSDAAAVFLCMAMYSATSGVCIDVLHISKGHHPLHCV